MCADYIYTWNSNWKRERERERAFSINFMNILYNIIHTLVLIHKNFPSLSSWTFVQRDIRVYVCVHQRLKSFFVFSISTKIDFIVQREIFYKAGIAIFLLLNILSAFFLLKIAIIFHVESSTVGVCQKFPLIVSFIEKSFMFCLCSILQILHW